MDNRSILKPAQRLQLVGWISDDYYSSNFIEYELFQADEDQPLAEGLFISGNVCSKVLEFRSNPNFKD